LQTTNRTNRKKNHKLDSKENKVFEQLKEKLCEAASQSLQTADFTQPFVIEVDSDMGIVGATFYEPMKTRGTNQ